MSPKSSRYRWFVVAIFFFFMLLHQTDKLMIGSTASARSVKTFNITNTQWGFINSGALIVGHIPLPDLGLPVRPFRARQTTGIGLLHLGCNHLAERHRQNVSPPSWPPALPPAWTIHPIPACTPWSPTISAPTCAAKSMAFCNSPSRLGICLA